MIETHRRCVASMLKSIDESLPVSTVRATRGKYSRAEPVSFGRSPDRLDALVWALTALMLEVRRQRRVRGV